MRKLIMICALIGLLLPAETASALAWTGNLLTNHGAETGTLDGWMADDPVVVVASQSQKETSGWVYPHSGDWFFNMARVSAAPSGVIASRILYQGIDVSSYAPDIDAGLLRVQGSAYLQTEDVTSLSGADYAQLTLYFLDEAGGEIDSLSTGLVQSPNLTWVKKTLDGPAPVGTRTIRFELLGEKHERTYINAFFDDANLQVAVVPEPAIEAAVDIEPNTLNLKSKGKWITCYIWFPEQYNVADIEPNSVLLEGEIGADWMWFEEADEELGQIAMAKFNRSDVQQMLVEVGELGDVELTVSGELTDGTRFEGTDTIRVIDKGGKK